ncbi:MAG TPA: hypothetical protein VHI78_12345 [Bacteroidales bacterium]|jgi:hypothetical protein|nr:hypothetical protein [Bacteroidales bacterium]
MKRLLIFSLLAGLCSVVAFAQQNLQKLRDSKFSGNSFSSPNSLKGMNSLVAELSKPENNTRKLHVNPEQIPTLKLKKILPPPPRVNDNMPILRPKGYFHGIVIKPDSAIDFKLIIKKP